MVAAAESRARDGEPGWERGGLGQCRWHLLTPDPDLRWRAREAVGLALDEGDLDAAFRLLVIAQYVADDRAQEVNEALRRHPDLLAHELTAWLADELLWSGEVPVY